MKLCEHCNGTGRVRIRVESSVETPKCPKCAGTGAKRKLTHDEARLKKNLSPRR